MTEAYVCLNRPYLPVIHSLIRIIIAKDIHCGFYLLNGSLIVSLDYRHIWAGSIGLEFDKAKKCIIRHNAIALPDLRSADYRIINLNERIWMPGLVLNGEAESSDCPNVSETKPLTLAVSESTICLSSVVS